MHRLLAFGALVSIPVTAVVAQPRQPSADWVVNSYESQCIASRNYGSAEEPLLLGLRASAPGQPVQLMVVRPGDTVAFADALPVTVATDAGLTFDTSMSEYASSDLEQQAYRIDLPLEHYAAIRKAGTLSIRSGGDLDVSFALGEMQTLTKVLDDCVGGLKAPAKG